MSEQFPLYPRLSEAGAEEAQVLVDDFKKMLQKAAQEIISNLYCDVAMYIQSDSWSNFRNELLAGLCNYRNRKIQAEYDFAKIRKQIFEEFRSEIIADLNQDLVAENEDLKRQLEQQREELQRRDRY